ncbi:MAG TPA: hypothetical protein VGF39_15375 [Stellaceae bacterium]|jgi:hypothetical protein
MLKLTIILFAGALAVATVPAQAVDLPDYGSKNFNPSGDTPSYFANEAAPVSARTADTTQGDWSAVDEMAPARPTFEGSRSAHTRSGRHGRYAFAPGSGRHGASRSGGTAHSAHVAGTGNAAKTSAKHNKSGARHANVDGVHYTVN